MIAYAAVDVKGGHAVQLIGGRPESERLSLADPVAVAERFVQAGFAALHVVDLDAAFGSGSNRAQVQAVIAAVGVPVQVGGGVRGLAAVEHWLAAGASRVIVGTRAVTDLSWLAETSAAHPGKVLVAADVRGEFVVTHGWRRNTEVRLAELLVQVRQMPIAGLLITDVDREGSLDGIDMERFGRITCSTSQAIIAAGGISSIEDLGALAAAGVAGAVVGTALYTGAIDLGAVAEEFTQ